MSIPNSFLQPLLDSIVPWLYYESKLWTAFGLIGNLLFSLRFIVQWLYSEKRKELVVPGLFWHLSFWGSVIALIYAFHIDKLPVILGYIFTPVLYARNLALLRRGKRKESIS
ncbi:MAG: lipid-A-disaccharide synthase N-terminal domain-containing protein [Deltaproteobacteria bacterium]